MAGLTATVQTLADHVIMMLCCCTVILFAIFCFSRFECFLRAEKPFPEFHTSHSTASFSLLLSTAEYQIRSVQKKNARFIAQLFFEKKVLGQSKDTMHRLKFRTLAHPFYYYYHNYSYYPDAAQEQGVPEC